MKLALFFNNFCTFSGFFHGENRPKNGQKCQKKHEKTTKKPVLGTGGRRFWAKQLAHLARASCKFFSEDFFPGAKTGAGLFEEEIAARPHPGHHVQKWFLAIFAGRGKNCVLGHRGAGQGCDFENGGPEKTADVQHKKGRDHVPRPHGTAHGPCRHAFRPPTRRRPTGVSHWGTDVAPGRSGEGRVRGRRAPSGLHARVAVSSDRYTPLHQPPSIGGGDGWKPQGDLTRTSD